MAKPGDLANASMRKEVHNVELGGSLELANCLRPGSYLDSWSDQHLLFPWLRSHGIPWCPCLIPGLPFIVHLVCASSLTCTKQSMVSIAEADEAADLPSYEDLGQATDLSAVEAGLAAAEASALPNSMAEEDFMGKP
eukprot:s1828_g6.t1